MTKGDKVQNKLNHNERAIIIGVERQYVPGYGFGHKIHIMQNGLLRWEPASKWEVIKEEGEHESG